MQKRVSNGKILIVDDLATNRALLRGILRSQGFETDECANGVECIGYCKKFVPAMVLLDVMMPELDGIQTCWQLRTDFSQEELPIIMVTNKAGGRDVAEGLAAGANDYVTKPIDRSALLARIANQLSVSSYQRQVHAQKASLERALAIQNAMGNALPEAIAIEQEDGALGYSNEQIARICGGTEPSDIADLMRRAFDGRLLIWLRDKASAGPDFQMNEEVTAKSGDPLTVQVISKPFHVPGGSALRLWFFRDVTGIRELEAKLSQRVRLDTVTVFASGIAHNFNNLFSAVLGSSELLERLTADNEKAQRCVTMIKRAVSGGCAVTRKLASLVSRDVRLSWADQPEISAVLRAVVDELPEETRRRISFKLAVDPDVPKALLHIDNLREILGNLMANAVEAIADEGQINISASGDGQGRLRVAIEDSGCGMELEVRERLFEPFFTTKNVDPSTGVGLQATGLGMWNVYHLLKSCGGDIEVHSEKGQGTKVRITLPAMPSPDLGSGTNG